MKIGLLGGSFNPIHLGHIAIARTVLRKTNLDEIWFLPTGNHPFKDNTELLNIIDRIKLIEKTISNYPDFKISKYDTASEKPNYTSELIKRLIKIHPKDEFSFIAGFDIIEELPKWHNINWLLENVKFIIVNRPEYSRQPQSLNYINKLRFVEMEPMPVSSSRIRELVKMGKSIAFLVPKKIIPDIVEYYKN